MDKNSKINKETCLFEFYWIIIDNLLQQFWVLLATNFEILFQEKPAIFKMCNFFG